MFEKFGFTKELSKEEEIEKVFNDALKVCNNLFYGELSELNIGNYTYSDTEAVEELGLDGELVHQLLEDYVIQVLKSISQFTLYIDQLKSNKQNHMTLDYTPLRELAHKNLGVARNLRIKDAEKLLYVLMKQDDLNYLQLTLKALESSAVCLKPSCAYDTLNLIKIKSTF